MIFFKKQPDFPKSAVNSNCFQISEFTADLADFFRKTTRLPLTDGIFETGAYRVPSKSLNPIFVGQGGPSKVCSF